MPFKYRSRNRAKDPEKQWGARKSSHPWSLRIAAIVLPVGLVALGVFLLWPAEEQVEEKAPESLQVARQVAEAFLAASDLEERLRWVRNPEAVETRLDDYTEEAREGTGVIERVLGHHEADGQSNTGFLVRHDSGNYRLLEVFGPPDDPKVDWDAYARYGTASWLDVRNGNVERAVVRVHCEPSVEAPAPFSDQNQWTAFQMSSQDYQGKVLAFAKVGHVREAMMKQVVLGSKDFRRRFTLEIVLHKGESGPVYEIVRCLAVGWVVTGDLEARWEEEQKEAVEGS